MIGATPAPRKVADGRGALVTLPPAMPDRLIRKILAPVELSELGETAMDYAVRLAEQLRAELVLFAVIDTPTTVRLIGAHRKARAGMGESFDTSLLSEARARLQQVVDEAARHGVRAMGHVTIGEDVEEQILKEALLQKVDLILVYSRGRIGLMKALLGNTAGDILKAAPCPVLVAPI